MAISPRVALPWALRQMDHVIYVVAADAAGMNGPGVTVRAPP